jgi:hypothetical protein
MELTLPSMVNLLLSNPEPTLKSLLEFILNTPDISGTKVHQYLKMAVKE